MVFFDFCLQYLHFSSMRHFFPHIFLFGVIVILNIKIVRGKKHHEHEPIEDLLV